MNCKPGDLAVVVWGPSVGAIVNVLESATSDENPEPCWLCVCLQFMDAWNYEVDGYSRIGPGDNVIAEDQALRPLRGDEGEDEMLRIAGKPQETVRDILKELAQQ